MNVRALRRPLVFVILTLFVGLVAFVACEYNCQLGEWHTLQKIEFAYRPIALAPGILLTNAEAKRMLCKISGTNKVWILLNPACHPMVKRMPAMDIRLTADEIQRVLNEPQLNEAVRQYLVNGSGSTDK